MATSRTSTKVIVVGGGGTMGASTAFHLLRSGYEPKNITVLDTYPIPSSQSAGHDLNKIMSVRIRNEVDMQLSFEARDMWKGDELFRSYFHMTGMVRHREPTHIRYLAANSCPVGLFGDGKGH